MNRTFDLQCQRLLNRLLQRLGVGRFARAVFDGQQCAGPRRQRLRGGRFRLFTGMRIEITLVDKMAGSKGAREKAKDDRSGAHGAKVADTWASRQECSFLKKRTKKLLHVASSTNGGRCTRVAACNE